MTGMMITLAAVSAMPGAERRGDLDMWAREITVRGKGGRPRVVRIGHEAARSRRYGASARSARARHTYDRIMESGP